MATTVGDVAIRVGADIGPLQRNMKKGSKSVDSFGSKVKTGAVTIAKLAAAAAAAGAAVAAFSKVIADNAVELRAQAKAANASIGEFQALSSAAKSVGVEQDKLADILKDVNDRVGDFLQTGGGPMADFFEKIAPQVGVTADQFAKLSGPDALQLYIKSLNQANLSQGEMTFFMEAIASDSTRLISLYKDNGEELNRLTSRYNELNSTLELSSGQAENLTELSGTFDLLGSTATNAATQVTATLAPAMNDFLEDAAEMIPKVTGALVDFINSFREAENITQVSSLERQIADVRDTISEAEENLNGFYGRSKTGQDEYNNQLLVARSRLEDLETQLEAVTAADKAMGKPGEDDTGPLTAAGQKAPEVELEMVIPEIADFDEVREREESYQAKSLQAYREFYNARVEASKEAANEEKQLEADRRQTMLNEASKGFGRLSALMETNHKGMFEIGKAAAISQTVIDTYAAAQASYKALAGIPVVGPALGAAAAGAAIVGGLARVQAISSRSFSKSGAAAKPGSGADNQAAQASQGSGGGGGGAETTPQQQVNLSLQGDVFSRNTVIGLIDQLNEAVADGAKIRVA